MKEKLKKGALLQEHSHPAQKNENAKKQSGSNSGSNKKTTGKQGGAKWTKNLYPVARMSQGENSNA